MKRRVTIGFGAGLLVLAVLGGLQTGVFAQQTGDAQSGISDTTIAAQDSEPPYHYADPQCADFCLREVGLYFRDCEECPVMVILPRGDFVMGSAEREPLRHPDEGPQRTVTIEDRFAIGAYEVSFDEWSACVADGFCRTHSHPHDEDWGRGRRPVVNVSHDDITDVHGFIAWLNSKVPGQPYRLPSEAEWEYAARAGTTTWFSTGKLVTDSQANFRASVPFVGSDTGVYRRETLPAGSFAPNAFRVHDMMGNAMEWTADCWHPSHEGAPQGPQARGAEAGGDCTKRVLRGGSWFSEPNELRSAFRARYDSGLRSRKAGFRVVRELETDVRWVEVQGGYEVKEARANISKARYYDIRMSHPSDQAGADVKLERAERNQQFVAQGRPEDRRPISPFRAARDLKIKSVTATVDGLPLEHHEFHLGDNCIYTEHWRDGERTLPRPGEIYCTGTSLWEGESYSRSLSFPGDLGLYLPVDNEIGCPVDIALIHPELLTPEDIAKTTVTCRIEYEPVEGEDTGGKMLRIPYLDQYPAAPELIQEDRPWYRAWDGELPLVVRGASVYFSPKPFRDQVIEDVCIYAIDADRNRVPGKSLCFEDMIYDAGANDLVYQPAFLEGGFTVEPGEYLSASCRLTKGNRAADCAIYVLVDIPASKRDEIITSATYTAEGQVNVDYLRGDYCQTEIFDYPLTVNGRNTIRATHITELEPWRTLVRQAGGQRNALETICPFIFLDGLEIPE